MSNHPAVPHSIAGRSHLGMHIATGQFRPAVMADFEGIITDKASTKALRLIKLIGINLRLGMIVRDVPGPASRAIDDLPIYHIGEGCIFVIENRPAGKTFH